MQKVNRKTKARRVAKSPPPPVKVKKSLRPRSRRTPRESRSEQGTDEQLRMRRAAAERQRRKWRKVEQAEGLIGASDDEDILIGTPSPAEGEDAGWDDELDMKLPPSETSEEADARIFREMNRLRKQIMNFADSFPGISRRRSEKSVVDALLVPKNEQLVRYIGCLAEGGKDGVEGWETLLRDRGCRKALVWGILGQALKEHVFGDLFFGGDNSLVEELGRKEREYMELDGFKRTKMRADLINHFASPKKGRAFTLSIIQIALSLEVMLLPLWRIARSRRTWTAKDRRQCLLKIVLTAANLSRHMRRMGNVVYYSTPTYKDEEFAPSRMDCLNIDDMISNSPYEKKTHKGIDHAVLKKGNEHVSEAIVRIVCFPGLVAYRQGGGELARKMLEQERAEMDGFSTCEQVPPDVRSRKRALADYLRDEVDESCGFRTRVICKSVVWLQWGKQKLLTKEAGTKAHLQAKSKGEADKRYEKDYEGYLALYDVFLERNRKADGGGGEGV